MNALIHSLISPQACGYFASVLVLLTFWMQRMIPLRIVGICSNIAFFTYAVLLHLPPIALLHATLLPINVWRLRQLCRPTTRPHPSARPDGLNWSRPCIAAASAVGLSMVLVSAAASRIDDDAPRPFGSLRAMNSVCPDLGRCAFLPSASVRNRAEESVTIPTPPI